MPVRHKFYQTNFGSGYETHNSILDITPTYKPEALIVGTFNPDTPHANYADFFYGRNYLWTAFENLFVHNDIVLTSRRMPQRGRPPVILNPSLEGIFEICLQLKLTFCDLIQEVLHRDNPVYHILPNDNIIYEGMEFNLIQDGRVNGINGLQQLNVLNQVHWNVNNIIDYLSQNEQIRTIYFTRQPTGIWGLQWYQIANNEAMRDREFINIITPSGQGRPVYHSMQRLLRHWVHNEDPNFGKLNNAWLVEHGVTLSHF
jgi:hypothetical protein